MAIEVVATRRGYINGVVVEAGHHFEVATPEKVSKRWMAEVGTDKYNAFMRGHGTTRQDTNDGITGERLAVGGIAEELALVTAELSRIWAENEELKAENQLLRARQDTEKADTPNPAEPDDEDAPQTEAPQRVRRRQVKKDD